MFSYYNRLALTVLGSELGVVAIFWRQRSNGKGGGCSDYLHANVSTKEYKQDVYPIWQPYRSSFLWRVGAINIGTPSSG